MGVITNNQIYTISFLEYDVRAVSSLNDLLSDAERERAVRFRKKSDQKAYVVSHGRLREILATRIGCHPADIVYGKGQRGKPFLKNHENLFFNLSHSGDFALIAISDQGEVGIDIEKKAPRDYLAIAKRFFSEQEYLYIKAHPQSDAFYDIWTAKEAYVKATGEGLAHNLSEFSVVQGGAICPQLQEGAILENFTVHSEYAAALVYLNATHK